MQSTTSHSNSQCARLLHWGPQRRRRTAAQPRNPSKAGSAHDKTARHHEVKELAWQRAQADDVQQATLGGTAKSRYTEGFNCLVELTQPDRAEKQRARGAVQALVRGLHSISLLKGSHPCVGGSYGRGTNIANNFDVDLLFFLREYKDRRLTPGDWRPGGILRRLILPEVATWLEQHAAHFRVQGEGLGYRAVLQLDVGGVEADLLLLPDCVEGRVVDHAMQQHEAIMGAQYRKLQALPRSARRSSLRDRAISEALQEFVRPLGDDVKGVARMLKAWHKLGCGVAVEERVPSVVLETLVLAAYQQLCSQVSLHQQIFVQRVSVPRLELFRCALQQLVRAVEDPDCVVTVDAGQWGYTRRLGLQFAHVWSEHPVRILHPIDPTCNMARPRWHRHTDWPRAAADAKALLYVMETGCFADLLRDDCSLGRAVAALRSGRS